MRTQAFTVFLFIALLQGCSGFHLRESTSLPAHYQKLQLLGASENNSFVKELKWAIEEAGGSLENQANTKLKFTNIREGKQIVAYDSDRKARVYLLSLKLSYEVLADQKNIKAFPLQRLSLDKTFVYDAKFALGKAEEEKQIRQKLYAEAVRLILLRLKYHQ